MVDLKSIAAAAVALLAGLSAFAWFGVGTDYGLGVLLAGLVGLVNLGLWVLAGKQMFRAVAEGRSEAGSAFIISTKLVGLGFAMWGLVQLFPVTAVLLGGSVVVFSILLHAAAVAMRELAVAPEA